MRCCGDKDVADGRRHSRKGRAQAARGARRQSSQECGMACVQLRLVWLLVGVIRIVVFTLGHTGSHGKFLSRVTTSSGFHLKSISL